MTTPANIPNQVGVQGINAQLALWISRAANAVNYLLGRVGGLPYSATGNFVYTPTANGTFVGTGFRFGTTAPGGNAAWSVTGVSCVNICGTFTAPNNAAGAFLGVAMFIGTGASPTAGATITGTQVTGYQYGGGDTTIGPYHPYSMTALIRWPAPDCWIDIGLSLSSTTGTEIREYNLNIFDVGL